MSHSPPVNRCIGVFDDSSTVRAVTERLLTRVGYEALPIETYEELLETIDRLDLLVLDVSLGALDGRDIARAVRQLPGSRAQLPMIAVTAYSDPDLKESLTNAGFVDFLHKPFRPQALYDKIEHWARKVNP